MRSIKRGDSGNETIVTSLRVIEYWLYLQFSSRIRSCPWKAEEKIAWEKNFLHGDDPYLISPIKLLFFSSSGNKEIEQIRWKDNTWFIVSEIGVPFVYQRNAYTCNWKISDLHRIVSQVFNARPRKSLRNVYSFCTSNLLKYIQNLP